MAHVQTIERVSVSKERAGRQHVSSRELNFLKEDFGDNYSYTYTASQKK